MKEELAEVGVDGCRALLAGIVTNELAVDRDTAGSEIWEAAAGEGDQREENSEALTLGSLPEGGAL